MSYQIKLEVFEGPMDLLFHLIKKNELNIYDIPIALITQQYFQYIEMLKGLNLEIAGEFLVMAATLTHIKSRMLLPKEETAEEQPEEDPRAELVRKLLEYQRYKEASGTLEDRESFWRDVFHREPAEFPSEPEEIQETLPGLDVGLFDLIDALQKVLERLPSEKVLEFQAEEISLKDRISVILDYLEREEALLFSALFDEAATRRSVIVTFLALLELVKMRLVRVHQLESMGPIRICRTSQDEESALPMDEGDNHHE